MHADSVPKTDAVICGLQGRRLAAFHVVFDIMCTWTDDVLMATGIDVLRCRSQLCPVCECVGPSSSHELPHRA